VGNLAILYCTVHGKPTPTAQWFRGGFAVNPSPSNFQQFLLVPTNTPHTTVYICVGINYAGGKKHTTSANITVIVKGKTAEHDCDFKQCSYG